MPNNQRKQDPNEARAITPADLIGASTVAEILGLHRSNVTRGVHAGTIPYVAQLDGPGGVYVFDRLEIEHLKVNQQ